MGRRLQIARGVVWCPLTEELGVAVSPLRDSPERCLLLTRRELDGLDGMAAQEPFDEETLDPQQAEWARKWLTPEFQLLSEATRPPAPSNAQRVAEMIYKELASAQDLKDAHDTVAYHREGIRDAFRQFEEVETTVSHLYRDPHPALGGKSYGGRFAERVCSQGIPEGARIMEVGCGTGLFCREFLREVRARDERLYEGLSYTCFDLSTVLRKSQEEVTAEHRRILTFETGDALSHAFERGRYDLVLCNEAIADFPVVRIEKGAATGTPAAEEALRLAETLGIDLSDAAPEFILNVGALRFLGVLKDCLKVGGRAILVEYGYPWAYPTKSAMRDHVEYSIHFGHLKRAAEAIGFAADLAPLTEFLSFAGDLPVLDGPCHDALFRHLLPFLGLRADRVRVYTMEELLAVLPEVAARTRHLGVAPMRTQEDIIYPAEFQVLTLAGRS